jgi:hypothetical protein
MLAAGFGLHELREHKRTSDEIDLPARSTEVIACDGEC